MKILVVSQYYRPEPFRISDICEELVKRGHEVTVVTGLPNYPMGEIYEGYRHRKKRDEVINGVKVHRCFTVGRRKGVLFRFLNYYSYMFSSVFYVKKLKEQFDVVFVNQLSPVMMAKAGIVYKKKNKVPLVLYCLDLWPVSLAAGGIDKGNPFYRYFRKVSGKIYKEADKLLITSRSFVDYFEKEFGITDAKYLPQYAEDLFSDEDLTKTPDEYYDFGFAGNIGRLQAVQTIIKAAELLETDRRIRFHIAGNGISFDECKRMAEGLQNVTFYGQLPIEEMPTFYKKMDAMLVTLVKGEALNTVMPGKVQSYMAARKPIIASIGGETRLVMEQARCGYCSLPEDAEAMKEAICRFINSPDKPEMGENAFRYYQENFRKEIFLEKLIAKLEAEGKHIYKETV